MITKFTAKEQALTHKPSGGMGAYGTPKRRKQLPARFFLDSANRKYPFKTSDGKVSRRLLDAAIHRAAQYGHTAIEARGRRLLQQYFGANRKGSKKVYVVSKRAIR